MPSRSAAPESRSEPRSCPRPARSAAPQKELPFPAETGAPGLPPVNLLQMGESKNPLAEAELVRLGETIRNRCAEFGVEGSIEGITPGPVITVFELQQNRSA